MFRQVVCLVAVLFGFQAFGQDNAPEVIGKVQPAPGKLAVIAPPITQSTFTGEDVKVHVGMKVKKKQLLIMISETAGVLDARRFDIDRAKARLKAAEVTLCYAEKALKRINALCPAKAVAECDQELHEGAFRKAEADLAVAQKELKIAEQALVLATCPIAAPIDGTVISLSVRPGESSGPGRERLIWGEILDASVVEVVFKTDDSQIKEYRLKPGISIPVLSGEPLKGKALKGEITFIKPVMDEEHQLDVLVRVDNPDGILRINEKVRVLLPLPQKK